MNNAKLVITNREKAFKNIKTVNISILPTRNVNIG